MKSRPGRVAGSCRFDPYKKAQVWDATTMAWKDIQRPVATDDEAAALVKKGDRFRVVTVTEKGRTFGPPQIKEA
jgi:hypothetical protein